jgi:hypothetical protein
MNVARETPGDGDLPPSAGSELVVLPPPRTVDTTVINIVIYGCAYQGFLGQLKSSLVRTVPSEQHQEKSR